MCSSSDFNRFCHIQDDSTMGNLQERIAAFWEATHVKCVRCWRLTLVWWVSRIAITVRGMAHAVAFTCRKRTHHAGGLLQWGKPTGMNSSLPHLQPYCVGVLQAAVLSLIQDVEASALVVRAVGPTGNLKHTYIDIFIYKERIIATTIQITGASSSCPISCLRFTVPAESSLSLLLTEMDMRNPHKWSQGLEHPLVVGCSIAHNPPLSYFR